MTDPRRALDAHAWDRSIGLWDAYFALAWTATLAFVCAADDRTAAVTCAMRHGLLD